MSDYEYDEADFDSGDEHEASVNELLDPLSDNFGSNLYGLVQGAVEQAYAPYHGASSQPYYQSEAASQRADADPNLILDAAAAEHGEFDRQHAVEMAAGLFQELRDRYQGHDDDIAEAALRFAAQSAAEEHANIAEGQSRLADVVATFGRELSTELDPRHVGDVATELLRHAGADMGALDEYAAMYALRVAAEQIARGGEAYEEDEMDIARRHGAVDNAMRPAPKSLAGAPASDEMDAARNFVGGSF